MKKILIYHIGRIVFSGFLVFVTITGASQNSQFYVNGVLQSQMIDLSTPETEWIKSVTKRYSPNSWYLLEQYDKLPQTISAEHVNGGTISSAKSISPYFFLKGNNKNELLLAMQTNVHEITHAYFSYNTFRYANENAIALNIDKAEGFFYLSPQRQYFISFFREAFFPSNELIQEIPEELRTFRFETYIDGNTSTQDLGLIGLLNEFNAYYIGSRFAYDMLEAYKIAGDNRASAFLQWVEHCQSTMSAYYEFEFYIREYLRYMKQEYPDNYELLLQYRPFSDVYLTIRTAYLDLITQYRERIVSEMQIINAIEQSIARIDKGMLWIKDEGGGETGTSIFSPDVDILKPILDGDRYRDITIDYKTLRKP